MSRDQRSRTAKTAAVKPAARRFPRVKLAIYLAICALPLAGIVSMLINGHWLPGAIYLAMSSVAFYLYWRDKRQAKTDGWRTPEKLLHGVELLGGWPGALIAQQALRHKTRKLSFQLVFWLIVALHQVVWIDQVLLGGNYLARHFY